MPTYYHFSDIVTDYGCPSWLKRLFVSFIDYLNKNYENYGANAQSITINKQADPKVISQIFYLSFNPMGQLDMTLSQFQQEEKVSDQKIEVLKRLFVYYIHPFVERQLQYGAIPFIPKSKQYADAHIKAATEIASAYFLQRAEALQKKTPTKTELECNVYFLEDGRILLEDLIFGRAGRMLKDVKLSYFNPFITIRENAVTSLAEEYYRKQIPSHQTYRNVARFLCRVDPLHWYQIPAIEKVTNTMIVEPTFTLFKQMLAEYLSDKSSFADSWYVSEIEDQLLTSCLQRTQQITKMSFPPNSEESYQYFINEFLRQRLCEEYRIAGNLINDQLSWYDYFVELKKERVKATER